MIDSSRWTAALADAELRLGSLPVVESLLLGIERGEPGALEEGAEAAAALHEFQDPEGSWQDSLLRTAEVLLLMRRLRPDAAADEAVRRACSWILSRQDRPGAFGSNCDADRHALGMCHHAVRGFFSPAPPAQSLGMLLLEQRQRIGTDADARLAASALALAALYAWGVAETRAMELQRGALARVVYLCAGPAPEFTSPAALLCVLRALLAAPPEGSTAPAVRAGLARFAASQRADGTWPGVDLFLALDLLADADAAGALGGAARTALERAAWLLAGAGGTAWEREGSAFALRAGARALRCLAGPGAAIVQEPALSTASLS